MVTQTLQNAYATVLSSDYFEQTPEVLQSLFVYDGRVFKIPDGAIYHNYYEPVSVGMDHFAANIAASSGHAMNIDSFLSTADDHVVNGYRATQIVVVETTVGFVWASRLQVKLDPEQREQVLGPNQSMVAGMGASFLWSWYESKSCTAWETSKERSRLDGLTRPLVAYEPTRNIMSTGLLSPSLVTGCTELAFDELTRAQKFFLLNIQVLGPRSPPRYSWDSYEAKLISFVLQTQNIASCRLPKPLWKAHDKQQTSLSLQLKTLRSPHVCKRVNLAHLEQLARSINRARGAPTLDPRTVRYDLPFLMDLDDPIDRERARNAREASCQNREKQAANVELCLARAVQAHRRPHHQTRRHCSSRASATACVGVAQSSPAASSPSTPVGLCASPMGRRR